MAWGAWLTTKGIMRGIRAADKARRAVPPRTQKQVEAKKRALAALFRANLKERK